MRRDDLSASRTCSCTVSSGRQDDRSSCGVGGVPVANGIGYGRAKALRHRRRSPRDRMDGRGRANRLRRGYGGQEALRHRNHSGHGKASSISSAPASRRCSAERPWILRHTRPRSRTSSRGWSSSWQCSAGYSNDDGGTEVPPYVMCHRDARSGRAKALRHRRNGRYFVGVAAMMRRITPSLLL